MDQNHGTVLLEHDTLIMQQRKNFMSNDFDIHDEHDNVIGHVATHGSAAGRFFMGSRTLSVLDLDGSPLAVVTDPVNLGFDKFEIHWADGVPLAQVRKRFTLIHKRVDIEVANGPVIELKGRLFDFDITFNVGGNAVAQATRQWAGFGRGFLGHSRYALMFTVPTPPREKLALIGGMLALDLIREKENN